MKKILILPLVLTFFWSHAQIQVFSDFENGNVEVINIDNVNNSIIFKPALKTPQNITRCWFYFGITGYDTSKTLNLCDNFIFNVIAPENPVFSYDKKNWQRLTCDSANDFFKFYSHKFNLDTVYFATGYPYTYSQVVNYVDSLAQTPYIDTFTLTFSEAGRRVPMFTIRNKNTSQQNLIWIIGRQHAFETTLNYVLEGMVNFFTSDDKIAKKLQDNTIIYIVPMMDVDNVFIGASGRMQKPIDFNRDWAVKSHWNAVKAVKDSIYNTSKIYNYQIFLDIHSSYPGAKKPIFGMFNSYPKNSKEYKNLKHFFKTFKKTSNYDLIEIKGNMKKNYADVYSSGIINEEIKTSLFSSTMECDWNYNFNNKPFTKTELRNIGYLIAKSLAIEINRTNTFFSKSSSPTK
jgi:hypothetical protein